MNSKTGKQNDNTAKPAGPKSRLLKSSGIVAAMTMISRLLGFARDMVFALVFGANAATDAFFVAFKIPNFLRRLFAEGAFSQAFVPIFNEYKEKRDKAALQQLVNHVAGTLGALLLVITTIGVCAAPLLIMLFAPGFIEDPQRYDLATDMLRWTFPYLFFISLTALAAGILNSFERFAVPALTPIFLNISFISCAFWLSPELNEPVMALAWAVFIAGILQLTFQIPFLQQLKLLPKPKWGWRDTGVQRIIKLMLPAIFGSAVVQINLLFDTLIASFLKTGSVSWLYYSDRLVEFPLGVFGIAIATVILPSLSQKHANASTQAFSNTIDWAMRLGALIGLPAMAGLITLAGPILATLFQYGEFQSNDTQMAAYSLMAYAIGLPAFIIVKILTPGFFARQDSKTPVRIGITAMVINMLMNIAFVVPMIMLDFVAPHVGLALATASSAWVHAGMLYFRLIKQGAYSPQLNNTLFYCKVIICTSLMTIAIYFALQHLQQWSEWQYWQRAYHLAGLIVGGALVYIISLILLGIRPRDLQESH